MNAIIYSEYPKHLVENKILPELKQYGFKVLKTVSNPSSIVNSALKDVDIILYMNELTNHNSYNLVKDRAYKNGIKLCTLSRKSSGWEKQFADGGLRVKKEEQVNQMLNGHVHDDNALFGENELTFFHKYIEFRNKKYSNPVIANMFGMKLPTLYTKLNRAKNHPQCPKFLKEYFKRPQIRGQHITNGNASIITEISQKEETPTKTNDDNPSTEIELLLKVAESEVSDYKTKLEKIKAVSINIKACSDMEILNHKDALNKLCELIAKI